MILTINKAAMCDHPGEAIEAIAAKVSARLYPLTEFIAPGQKPFGNVYVAITWVKGSRVSFTIRTRYSKKHGSRTSASGRHMPKASWEAHRDVMLALFEVWPEATLRTAHATYRGRQNFLDTFEATGNHNVGSQFHPVTILSCSI